MRTPALAARGLARHFGPVAALLPTDFDVYGGEVFAVIGPNGAGKTTLVRLLAGLARPSAGEIRLDGDAAGERRQRRARIGLVAHQTLLYPALTARENLALAARLYGLADPGERAARWLDELELTPFADRRAGGFSRGTAQRLAIARALVHDPPILLLDEPFAGLDVRAAERLAELLAGLRGEGRALVLISHQLARVAALADRGMLLVEGRSHPLEPEVVRDAAALERAYRAALGEGPRASRRAS